MNTSEIMESLNIAQRHKNFNAYGWLMRFMQCDDDIIKLEKERDSLLTHAKRVREELFAEEIKRGLKDE